jgi:hypothetical protein
MGCVVIFGAVPSTMVSVTVNTDGADVTVPPEFVATKV